MFNGAIIGQYLPGDTPIHRLDPRTKLVLVFLLSIIVFLPTGFFGPGLAALLLVLGLALGRISPGFLWRGLRPILVFALIAMIFNLVLTPGRPVFTWGVINVTEEGIRVAALAMLRLVLVVLAATMLTLTTSPMALTDGLERLLRPFQRVGLPAHELALMMTIALRFVPTLIDEADRLIKAQESRGADLRRGGMMARIRAMVPVLIPLFVASFRRADDLAVAMEARLYRGGAGRTRMHELQYGAADVVAYGLFAALTAGIVWRLVQH